MNLWNINAELKYNNENLVSPILKNAKFHVKSLKSVVLKIIHFILKYTINFILKYT